MAASSLNKDDSLGSDEENNQDAALSGTLNRERCRMVGCDSCISVAAVARKADFYCAHHQQHAEAAGYSAGTCFPGMIHDNLISTIHT